jgi:nucleoside-diphosphate kinase
MENKRLERTYIMLKPDGVQRGVVGESISRFEKKGFKLIALKMYTPSKELLEEHYKELKEKPFFPKLMSYMLMGPVVCMVWQGRNAVATGRKILGKTNPFDSEPGTIRGDFGIESGRNIIHGSDSVESAEREIKLWFTPEEIQKWEKDEDKWLYE